MRRTRMPPIFIEGQVRKFKNLQLATAYVTMCQKEEKKMPVTQAKNKQRLKCAILLCDGPHALVCTFFLPTFCCLVCRKSIHYCQKVP